MFNIDDARRPHLHKRHLAGGLLATVLLALFIPLFSDSRISYAAVNIRLFDDASAFNAPIGDTVALDPDSSAMVGNLSSGAHPGIANTGDFGYPIYYANPTTPRYRIGCTMDWGTCDLERELVPIPNEARANSGSDGKLQVIDLTSGKAYEFWQYRNDFATTSWGYINPDIHSGDGRPGATGAGISQIAGIVQVAEVVTGHIDHALTFSTRFCQGPGDAPHHRYPATKSDGKWFGPGAVPEGARVQLDPAVNVDAIPGITTGEKMIARALQKYGAYAVDCGVAEMAFGFESPITGLDPYPGIGFEWDYYAMDHIPWDRLRVLAAWDSHSAAAPAGTPVAALTPAATATPATTPPVPTTPPLPITTPTPALPATETPPWMRHVFSWLLWFCGVLDG